MEIEAKVEGGEGLSRLGNVLGKARNIVLSALKKEGKIFGLDAVGRAKKDYLSGPRSRTRLGVVSGRLRSSITEEVSTEGSDVVVRVGTNVEYAPMHELGFEGMIHVPAFTRVVTKVFGNSVTARASNVRAHQRRVSMPARPFITPAVGDAIPGYENSIRRILTDLIFDEGGNNGAIGE